MQARRTQVEILGGKSFLLIHQWASIFSRQQRNKLPIHSGYDHRIKLVEGAEAPWGPLYEMSEQELRGPREWLDKQVAAGKITKSNSSAGTPIL